MNKLLALLGLLTLSSISNHSNAINVTVVKQHIQSTFTNMSQEEMGSMLSSPDLDIVRRYPDYAGFYKVNGQPYIMVKYHSSHSTVLNAYLPKTVRRLYATLDDFTSIVKIVPAKYSLLELAKYNFIILNTTKGLISGTGYTIDDNKPFIGYDNSENIPKIKNVLARLNIPEDAYTISYAKFTIGTDPPTPTPSSPIP